MLTIPGRGGDIGHGNGIAESVCTRGEGKYVRIGVVVSHVGCVSHFEALAYRLSYSRLLE